MEGTPTLAYPAFLELSSSSLEVSVWQPQPNAVFPTLVLDTRFYRRQTDGELRTAFAAVENFLIEHVGDTLKRTELVCFISRQEKLVLAASGVSGYFFEQLQPAEEFLRASDSALVRSPESVFHLRQLERNEDPSGMPVFIKLFSLLVSRVGVRALSARQCRRIAVEKLTFTRLDDEEEEEDFSPPYLEPNDYSYD
jgi:hypothetical protein